MMHKFPWVMLVCEDSFSGSSLENTYGTCSCPGKCQSQCTVSITCVIHYLPWKEEISPLRNSESWRCRSVIQCLPRMYKTLSSNHSTRNKQTSALYCLGCQKHISDMCFELPSTLAFIFPSNCYSQALFSEISGPLGKPSSTALGN